ncbi:MAG: PssE/Cps14G family polysaccharide biosynthesis glycosyltransferase [Terrisporobacter othiniensis]|uniref:PssE/Cps14G family polysaccharide biosynthesis glycosyltransferase n=1 Tax=Terrisporobacter othiniensis TaxID=1577792 RepID=UPI0029119EB6|nr:PssE/Cps14G family polysaccharide biosynthesis glycosyltransferase [Terrisporobacter othiniensis]MDU6983192.1 PssE/Cps14G family polysaccharide biosynthesis glycosyltransferase [Terrisporobacter othiniensis]
MIFVTLGSQKFQFNRLLIELDRLIKEGIIKEDIFAQIGYSDYAPKNYTYKKFLDREEFAEIMERSDIVITHGGTGAIIGAVKQSKKVIAVPRLKEYDEHVDNHQKQIVEQFNNMGFIYGLNNVSEIVQAINNIKTFEVKKYESNTKEIITSIDEFLNSN